MVKEGEILEKLITFNDEYLWFDMNRYDCENRFETSIYGI